MINKYIELFIYDISMYLGEIIIINKYFIMDIDEFMQENYDKYKSIIDKMIGSKVNNIGDIDFSYMLGNYELISELNKFINNNLYFIKIMDSIGKEDIKIINTMVCEFISNINSKENNLVYSKIKQ